jgi:alpha-glucosidase
MNFGKKDLAVLILAVVMAAFTEAQAINCTSFAASGNEVTFRMDDNSALQMKLCSQSMIRMWLSADGSLKRSNPSFAVVNEALEDVGTVSVDNQTSCYEIFTSKLRIRVNKSPMSIQIFDKYQKLIFSDFTDKGHIIKGTQKVENKTMRRDEHFFGLGEKTGKLDRRGESYKMWNSDRPCYSTTEDPLYKSIPFFMSNYHYGIFLDNTYKTEFKFGTENREYYSFEVPDGEMIYYFIYGKDYKDIIGQYTQLTGSPIMPPRWAMGFAQCRGLLTNEKLTREIAEGYRKRGIPCDIIYQDIGWTEYLQDFNWKRANYTDPKGMLADLHKMGFHVIVSQDPVVSQSNKVQWHEADSLGYFAKDVRTGKSYDMPWPWGGNCGVVDFTLPAVADWWGQYQQKSISDGVDGFWTDMGEPAWSNEDQPERLLMRHYAGTHAEIHNVYGLNWNKVVKEQFEKRNPGLRPFQMTRSTFAGAQRYTFGWTGDSGNGDDVLQGWQQMANQIPVLLSDGLGVMPFTTCDISGYCGDIHDYPAMAELYTRWVQMGAFTPLSRIHHEGNNAVEPWLFGEEAEKNVRKAIELKYTLLPYIYTFAREAHDTGLPIMRAMMLEYPSDAETYSCDEQFMLGDQLLVAPVVKKGAVSRNLYLPEGKWINYNDKRTIYAGGSFVTVDAPLSVVPMFVKQGSIIPTMPAMNYSNEHKNCAVTYQIFPAENGGKCSFTLYEDNGNDLGYLREQWAKTPIACSSEICKYSIAVSARQGKGYEVPQRSQIMEVYMPYAPKSVMIGGVKVKKISADKFGNANAKTADSATWTWDKTKGACSVRLADTGKETNIEINY